MTRPTFDSSGALQYYVEPDTWCNPMYSLGPVWDLMVEAWKKRAATCEFEPRAVDQLLVLVEHAVYMSAKDGKGIASKLEAIKKRELPWGSISMSYQTPKDLVKLRRDPAFELLPLQIIVKEIFRILAPAPPPAKYESQFKPARQRVYGSLYYFDMWTVEEAELPWRVKDAEWKSKAQIRGRERIAAFEALWTGGEHARAYEFVGAKLPPAWKDPTP